MHSFAQTASVSSASDAPSTPRTWSFTSTVTSAQTEVTCLPGCTIDHARDIATPTHPEDIYCQTDGPAGELPLYGTLCETDGPEPFRILAWHIGINPFSGKLAERLPHVDIEVIDDHWIETLDPDALATVISELEKQVATLRTAHAQLVAVRAAYGNLPEATA